MATSESWRDKASGERKEHTEWHRVVIYNENLAKVAEQYLRKGSKVYLEGQLQTRKYTDKDGQEKYHDRDGAHALPRRTGDAGCPGRERRASERADPGHGWSGAGESRSFHRDELDDEIPF